MQNVRLLIVLFITSLITEAAFSQKKKQETYPPRLRRSECFFGLHFDFHAGKQSTVPVGESLTSGMVDSLLMIVKPDYIQVDGKGHPGIASYPTKVGTPARNFAKDPLQVFRESTARRGVSLFVHYSGVIDREAVQQHPEWGIRKADGSLAGGATSVHGPYADQILIPQLKEISKNYQVDGAWIDGECWGLIPDYSPAALAFYKKKSGSDSVPSVPGTGAYRDFLEFNRKSFRNYLARYVEAMHAYNPAFQIASNWAFSSIMPEPVDVNVDFLSGDLSPVNGVNSAAFEARCLAPQGKPWDVMSWSFSRIITGADVTSQKSAVQLQQEAAEIIAMGGGYQMYFKQNKDASIQPWTIPLMKQVGDFCRARQRWCHQAKAVPQVALLYSTAGHKYKTTSVYRDWSGELKHLEGTLTALLDGQHAVEVLMEHHLRGNMHKYPLIVVPEWEYLLPDFRQELLQYVSGGGHLLVIGPKTIRLFEKELGITVKEAVEVKPKTNTWFGFDNTMAGFLSPYLRVSANGGTSTFGHIYQNHDTRYPVSPLASIRPVGKGSIAAIYMNLGENYGDFRTYAHRDLLSRLTGQLLLDPLVRVEGSKLVHLIPVTKNGRLQVNLINAGGFHRDKTVFSYDELPALGPIKVQVRIAQKPQKIVLQPEGKAVPFEYADGKVSFIVPSLSVHTVAVLE